jgi:hypothetical protein
LLTVSRTLTCAPPEFGEQLGREVLRGADHGDVQLAAAGPLQRVDRLVRLAQQLLDRPRIARDLAAGGRELEATPDVLEERQSHLVLELPQLERHGGLRQVHLGGRAPEMQVARGTLEDLELTQRHVPQPSSLQENLFDALKTFSSANANGLLICIRRRAREP